MRKFIFLICFITAPFRVSADAEALGLAIDALNGGDRALAVEALATIDDPVARDIIAWRELRAGRGEFGEYLSFLDRNPDWPGLPYLRQRGEQAMPRDGDPGVVLSYFEEHLPQTGAGVLALTRALDESGDRPAAEAEAIRGWTTMVLSGAEATALRQAFGDLLNGGGHHIARLDQLLWEGAEDRARAMFPLVPEGWQALASARIALRERRPGVDDLIEAVPASLRSHPGLAYERFLWRIQSGFWDTAGDLMAETSTSADALGRPEVWADRRADLKKR